MKLLYKTLLIVGLIFTSISTSTYAQRYESNSYWTRQEPSVRFGIKGALTVTDIKGMPASKQNVGYKFGATVDFHLSENLPFYINTGVDINEKGADGKGKSQAQLTYLQVPLHLAYKPIIAEDVKFVIFAGGYFGYGIDGKLKRFGDVKKTDIFTDGGFKKIDYGVSFGVGLEVSHVSFGLGYELGLNNIAEKGPMMSPVLTDKCKNRSFYASVGYIF